MVANSVESNSKRGRIAEEEEQPGMESDNSCFRANQKCKKQNIKLGFLSVCTTHKNESFGATAADDD